MVKKKSKKKVRRSLKGWGFVLCFAIPCLFLLYGVFQMTDDTEKIIEFFKCVGMAAGLIFVLIWLPCAGIIGMKAMIISDAIDANRPDDEEDDK